MRTFIDHPYTLWVLLALPSLPMIGALLSDATGPDGQAATAFLLHPTGEFSARFLIICLMITPLRQIWPQSGFLRWMAKRRRYFGVAAFFYAALHTMLYVIDLNSLRALLGQALELGIWTGWVAMIIFVPLALTSTDAAVRRMGPRWKMLQRWVYVAAVATLLHWIFVHNTLGPALVHFVPLAALEAYRLWTYMRPKHRPA